MTLEEVEFLISQNLQAVAQEFSFFQGYKKLKCNIACDLHNEPYYGKDLEEEGQRLVFYTKKHGKSKIALRYGTISIVFSEKFD